MKMYRDEKHTKPSGDDFICRILTNIKPFWF